VLLLGLPRVLVEALVLALLLSLQLTTTVSRGLAYRALPGG
jgi:hypothetical protein